MAGLDLCAFSPRTRSVGIHGFAVAWIEAEKGADHRVAPVDHDYGWGRNS
jgi:hypothetical protein